MKKTLLLAAFCVITAVATTQAADVKAIWDKDCAKCHGADGKGDTKMGKKLEVKDYTDAKVQAAMTDDEMVKIIKQGKKEGDKTKMKAFADLSDADVKALVAHVRSMKKYRFPGDSRLYPEGSQRIARRFQRRGARTQAPQSR